MASPRTLPYFPFDCRLERTPLLGAQVCGFLLVVKRQQPDLSISEQEVIDHPQAASLPLAPPPVRPAQLAAAARPGYQVASCGVEGEEELKSSVIVLRQVAAEELGEDRRLDEFHAATIRKSRRPGKPHRLPTWSRLP